MTRSASRKTSAHWLFFPAAALYAALVVPASVLALRGDLALPALATPWRHAHELLFGFALAVVAGFLMGRERIGRVIGLFALWLIARLTALLQPDGPAAAIGNSAFAVALAALAAPQFLTAAKKLRNQAFAPTLLALSAAVVAFHAGGLGFGVAARYGAVHAGVLLLTVLMLFMAGRIIAPAAAGAARLAGHHLEARVQPRLEGALLVLMLLALLTGLVPGLQTAMAPALLAAGIIAAVRLLRWRLWWCRARPDLLCLGAGYAWLAAGLILWGAAELTGTPARGAAIHAITVGALGTLTITVMARAWLLKAGREPQRAPEPVIAVGLIAAAALLRLAAPQHESALFAAALFWSLAYALLLAVFLRVPAGRRRSHR